MVLLGSELQHGRSEQSPLHARLDLQARIGCDELFEAGDVRTVVVLAAERLRERAVHGLVLDQEVQLAEHALAMLVLAQLVHAPEGRILDHRTRRAARVGPGAQQKVVDPIDIDARGIVVTV